MEFKKAIKKAIWVVSLCLFLLVVIFVYQLLRFSDKTLRITFCNVGQGDGIHIKTPNGTDILIDAGPDDKILNCLGDSMPFWDKTIELAFLTHPHADHFVGFIDILKRYKIGLFATEEVANDIAGYKALVQALSSANISTKHLYRSDVFKSADGVVVTVLWPTKDFLTKTSPNGLIGEGQEFASFAILLSYRSFHVLFTGDSQKESLAKAISFRGSVPVDVLQIPHHGSKTGVDQSIINKINPKIAVISVGKNNYGHPSPQVLEILGDKNIKILRTDQEGTIEIISDGKSFGIKK